MGQQIIKQPNGKLALFSSNSDTIIAYDLTAEQILDRRIKEAIRDACRNFEHSMELVEKYGTSAFKPFGYTWEEALEVHKDHDGEDFEIEQTDG